MERCIPCEENKTRNAKVQAADVAGRAFMRENNIDSVVLVEVLRDADGFKAGDYTFCLPNDERLTTFFYEINILIR